MLYIIQSLIFIPIYLLMPDTVAINNHILHLVFISYMVIIYKQLFNNHVLITLLKAIVIFVAFVLAFWFALRGYVYLKHLIFG